MTRNTLTFKELEEKKRSNLANESLKRDELAETISNNLRNYRINVSKNQIQKLANDQLDAREARKITETIDNNLRQYSLQLRSQIETERNNKRKNELESELNEIKRVDSLLQAAKATGKDPVSMLISWFSNQANLAAFAGKNDFTAFWDWLNTEPEGDTPSSKMKSSVVDRINKVPYFEDSDTSSYHGRGYNTKEKNVQSTLVNRINRGKRRKSKEDENEIPEDYSNSSGPGGKDEKFNEQTKANETSWTRSRENAQSNKGPGFDISEDNSGRTKVIGPKQSGPGIGLAFS